MTISSFSQPSSERLILLQLQQMPDHLKQEVLDFVGLLFAKHNLPKSKKNRPKFGSAKGKYRMAADFDEPLEIFKDYME